MASLQANSKHISIVVRMVDGDTYRLFKSYDAVVGLQKNDNAPIFTDRRYSVTTSRHIRKFMYEHGGKQVGHTCFREQVQATGLD